MFDVGSFASKRHVPRLPTTIKLIGQLPNQLRVLHYKNQFNHVFNHLGSLGCLLHQTLVEYKTWVLNQDVHGKSEMLHLHRRDESGWERLDSRPTSFLSVLKIHSSHRLGVNSKTIS